MFGRRFTQQLNFLSFLNRSLRGGDGSGHYSRDADVCAGYSLDVTMSTCLCSSSPATPDLTRRPSNLHSTFHIVIHSSYTSLSGPLSFASFLQGSDRLFRKAARDSRSTNQRRQGLAGCSRTTSLARKRRPPSSRGKGGTLPFRDRNVGCTARRLSLWHDNCWRGIVHASHFPKQPGSVRVRVSKNP